MRRRWAIGGAAIIVIVASLCFLSLQKYTSTLQSVLHLRNHTYQLAVAQTEADREHGLSDSASLASDHAMLFVFPNVGRPGIWMKDMNYPIDIVWLNNEKKVVYTVVNAQPSSYPDTIFQPNKDSRYVIELPAGTIEKTGIHRGDTADITVIN